MKKKTQKAFAGEIELVPGQIKEKTKNGERNGEGESRLHRLTASRHDYL